MIHHLHLRYLEQYLDTLSSWQTHPLMDSPLIEIRARISPSVRYSIIDRSLTWLRECSSLLPPCPLRKPMLMPSPPILRPFTFIPDHRAFFRIALVTATTRSVRNEYTHIYNANPQCHSISFIPIISACTS